MRAGELRQRFQIQAHTQELDVYGDPAPSENDETDWTTEATVYGAFQPLVGREAVEAKRESSELTGWMIIRYRAGVTPEKRIKWGSRKFNILSVVDVDGRHRELRIMVKEVVSSGLPHGA